MPVGAYYSGAGNKVMRSMRKTYPSEEKAKQVFYATANARGQNPSKDAALDKFMDIQSRARNDLKRRNEVSANTAALIWLSDDMRELDDLSRDLAMPPDIRAAAKKRHNILWQQAKFRAGESPLDCKKSVDPEACMKRHAPRPMTGEEMGHAYSRYGHTKDQRSAKLFWRDPDTNKDREYHLSIEPKGKQYVVNFAFGRRGQWLKEGTKTPTPVPLDAAKRIFGDLYYEKTRKGYTTREPVADFSMKRALSAALLAGSLLPTVPWSPDDTVEERNHPALRREAPALAGSADRLHRALDRVIDRCRDRRAFDAVRRALG